MKKFTLIFTSLLMIFAATVFANSNTKVYEGSITLENGEILTGKIQMLSPVLNEIKVKFIDGNEFSTIYKVDEVATYSFFFPKYNAKTKSYDNQLVEYIKKEVAVSPVPFGPKVVLIERQVKGTISLYNFYAETRASSEAFTHTYLIEKDGKMMALNTGNYKIILADLVADYAELKTKVGEKGYNYAFIADVITSYNIYTAPKAQLYGVR